MESAAPFQPYQALQSLQQTACTCPSPFSVPVQLTLGLTALHQAGAQCPLCVCINCPQFFPAHQARGVNPAEKELLICKQGRMWQLSHRRRL